MTDWISEANALFEYTQSLRRDFHMHPELGFQEMRTAGIVARELSKLGLEVTTGIGQTGVVALIEGARPGPVLMLRADMDALPILEETGAPYASQTPGVMHACGHDGHTAILLTVARLLHSHRDKLAGTVKLVFQPAEEGLGGASRMIEDGVLENPKVDFALSLHLWNEQPLGWLGIPAGPVMAGGEIFKVKVIGKGGHGAAPHLAIDPIFASAQVISALQGIAARNVPPLKAAVISVCTIHGGETFNVIPSEVELTGTIRTFDLDVRQSVLERFEQTVRSTAEGLGCRVEIDLHRLTPALVNNSTITARVQETAQQLFPDSDLITGGYITMGSEDMAFFLERVPGCFFFVGSANPEKGLDAAHHHPRFDFDEAVLPRAAALLAASAAAILNSEIRA
ncbi:MAG: amidohydrolase [Anaerolineales bacterium]|nr:amidohydrolase [Anaerolineales bacterium]MDW8228083.1 amidohydrolase [Anaerolineales bacterium]